MVKSVWVFVRPVSYQTTRALSFKEDIIILKKVQGRGVGDTHITDRHFGGDTHITSDMCAGIHISRGYTYHCDTGLPVVQKWLVGLHYQPPFGFPEASRDNLSIKLLFFKRRSKGRKGKGSLERIERADLLGLT